MAIIKCVACGKKIQDSSSGCIYCGFDMANKERDANIKIVIEQPNGLTFGDKNVALFNKSTGEMLAQLKFGDTFNLQITEPTTIQAKKTAWKTGSITLYAKPHATYAVTFKNGLFSSKIVIKDITEKQVATE